MKTKLFLSGCFLLLALFCLLSGTDKVQAAALRQDPTETPTPQPSPSPTWEDLIKTPTQRPRENSTCPEGQNPSGWGYVTPDPLWKMACSHCITETPRAIWPTFQIATMAPASTLDPTLFPTQYALSQTVYPTATSTVYQTPTIAPTSTPTGDWWGYGKPINITRSVNYGTQANFGTISASTYCPGGQIAGIHITNTRTHLWWSYDGIQSWESTFATTSQYMGVYGTPELMSKLLFPNQSKIDAKPGNHSSSINPKINTYDSNMTATIDLVICKGYHYQAPTEVPTAGPTSTPPSSYCTSVKPKGSDNFGLPSIKVGPLDPANCSIFPGVWIAKTSPLFTVPCGLFTCNIPDAGIGFPEVRVCYRPIKVDNYEILSQPIDLNLLMFVAGAVMLLRFLRRK